MLAVAGPADASSHGKPATWVNVLKLVLGLLLLLVAVRQWHGRPRPGHEVEPPKWMGSIERFTPVKAVGAGAVLSGANPKNLLLAVGAAAAIAQTGIGSGDQAIAYVVFALIATVGVATPVVMFFALGDRSQRILRLARLDGPAQRGHYGRYLPDHRGQADRRRHAFIAPSR